MGIGFILFAGGLVIILGLYLWTRQRQSLGHVGDIEIAPQLDRLPMADSDDAVLVSREHGQLVFVNERARSWLGMNGGQPSLEHIAAQAQPADNFLELFAGQGQASFKLGSRWVEASSHTIPDDRDPRTVIVMREISAGSNSAGTLDLSAAMGIINEIGETINASMSLQQVYQALLTIVMKVMSANAGEICIWDESTRTLSPLGWSGDYSYLLKLQESGGLYQQNEGVSGWIAEYQKAALVSDIADPTAIQPKLAGFYKSFVGVPLLLGTRFVGTLELAHKQSGSFNQSHLALLQAVSKQVAISIFNAELYSDQSKRITDMATIGSLGDFGDTMLEPRTIYQTLNARVAQILSVEIAGVLLYNENRRALVPELPFYGLPDNLAQTYIIPLPLESPQRDIYERQEYWVTNDATEEELIVALGLKPILDVAGVKNMALLPLQIGDQRIGMMQISNKKAAGGFSSQDIREMKLLVGQAAIVVENLRLHQQEVRRDSELSGLQEITHAIGSLSREEEFYSTINERIARQMGVMMCGILLYDEQKQQLISQLPFHGITDEVVTDYSISLQAGTPLGDIWDEVDFWFSNRVQTDAVVFAAGLAEKATQLGVQKTLLAVLSVGGRRLGVVQASNKINGEDFNDKDARLILIFATQVAAMIENARLYRDMQRNAEQATSLKEVAEMAGSVLTNDDSFTQVMAEIARLTTSPIVYINTLDQQTGSLITYPRWVFGMELAEPITFDIYSQHFSESVALTQNPFFSNDILRDKRVADSYRATAVQVGLDKLVLVPLMVGDRSLGELGIANRPNEPYTPADIDLLAAIAAQIAATIERLRLYEATGENLSRRQLELDAIARISTILSETLDVDQILDVIRLEAARATRADGSTVVLFTPPKSWASPTTPEMAKRLGNLKQVNTIADIEVEAFQRGLNSIVVTDYVTTAMNAVPGEARSAVAAAFLYEDRVVGVLHLYHSRPNSFDERAAAFLTTLAAKASLGYGNYIRYQEQIDRSNRLRRRVEQLNQIFELGRTLQGNLDQVTLMENILDSIQHAVGYNIGVVALLDSESGILHRIAQLGMPIDAFERSKNTTITLPDLKTFLNPTYQLSESYFYPIEEITRWQIIDVSAIKTDFPGKPPVSFTEVERPWQDGDILLVPLLSPDSELIGVMSLDRPQDGQRPDRGVMEVLEIFAHEAEASIETIRLYLASVQNAEQESRLNDMMEQISTSLAVPQIVEAVAYGALRLVPLNQMTVMLADTENAGYEMMHVTVQPDGSIVTSASQTDQIKNTVMGKAYDDSQDIFLSSGDPAAQAYSDLRMAYLNGERTSLVLPLLAAGGAVGAIHFGSQQIDSAAFTEFRPLLKRIVNLAAVALQNARSLDQALNLRNFNESVVESIQQGIVVLDQTGRILSINDFMEQRYGWKSEVALRQNLFEFQPGLQGILGEDVRLVLESGVPRERINHVTWQTAGRQLVQNFYTYPLRSGDNIRGAVILVEDVTDRVQLERDLEARANQLSMLAEISSRITASLNRDEVIKLAINEVARVVSCDTMTLWTRTGDRLELEGFSQFHDDFRISEGDNYQIEINTHERIRVLIDLKAPFAINDLQEKTKLPGDERGGSWLGVPLVNQGHVAGVIALTKREPNFYDEQAEQAALAFANQVAIALENATLFSDAQYQTERLSLLNRVSVQLAQSLDSENILEIAGREIAQTTLATNARALLFERTSAVAQVIMQYPRGTEPPERLVLIQDSAILQNIRRNASPLIVHETVQLGARDPIRLELEGRGIRSYAVIPMTVAGQVIGVIELWFVEMVLNPFRPEQIELALIIANQTAIAVQNTNLLEQTLIRTRELETLLEAAQATALTLSLDEAYRSVAMLMMQALEMEHCLVMMWDNVENTARVEIDMSLYGEINRVAPPGTTYNLREYAAKRRALEQREIQIVTQESDDAVEYKNLTQTNGALRVLIPLTVRDQAIGVVQVQRSHMVREFMHRDMRLASALATQAATAIQNARLSTETAALVEEGFLINSLSQALSSTLDLNEMIGIIREQVPVVTKAEEMYLALYDPDTQMITFPMAVRRGGVDFTIEPRALNTDEVSFIVRHRRSLALGGGNWSSDEMRRNLSISNGEGDARSYLGVPVAAGDQVLGVLGLRDRQNVRAFGINDERLLTTVGTQLGAGIQNARLFERVNNFARELNQRVQDRTVELQKERDRLDMLYKITSELSRTLDMDRVLKRALEMVSAAVDAEEGVIMLLDPLTDQLMIRALLHDGLADDGDPNMPHPARMLAQWSMDNEHLLIANDLHGEPYWDMSVAGAVQWRSALAVILESNDDPQGVMVLLNREPVAFTEMHLKLVIASAAQVAAAINNADLYHLIRDQAERLGSLVRVEQEQAEKNSSIVEGITDGVVLADVDGTVVLFNSASERILGMNRDRAVGESLYGLGSMFNVPFEQWTPTINRWATQAALYQEGEFLSEIVPIRERNVQIRLSPVYVNGDRFLGTVSVFRDITREVEADRLKSDFVANVSHELRTPMTSIKGFVDLMLMGVTGPVNDQQQSFLSKIKTNSDRLSKLVEDLLNISKLDSGEGLEVETLDMAEVMNQVLSTVQNRSEHVNKKMRVKTDISDDLPAIEGDRAKLTQVMGNVIENAFHYTYPGGQIDISAKLETGGQRVLIAVADTGIGIPDSFRNRIWGRFERYEDHALVMDVPGTGLGLSIVRELVLMHHGEIWFDSELGKGTTFYVALPLKQPTKLDTIGQ
jgi:PAS domain S-box-containing protein